MKSKTVMTKEFIIHVNLLFVMVATSLILLFSGVAIPFVECFAVDDQDNIYISGYSKIYVYEGKNRIRTLSAQTSSGYMFTIKEDNTILLSTASKVYSMDLYGNILSSNPDPSCDTYNQIQYRKNRFTTQIGDTYKIVSSLGWTRIVKNGTTVVYRISSISFIIKIMLYISSCACVALPIIYIRKARKMQNQKDTSDESQ